MKNSVLDISKDQGYLFDNAFFGWLDKLHCTYGCVFSLYIQDWYQLKTIGNNRFPELRENADWLKFGIHTTGDGNHFQNIGLHQGKNEWEGFVREIIRIGGSKESIDRMPRLHMFAGNIDCLFGMSTANSCPALGFLTADDSRKSYYLEQKSNEMLHNKNCYIYDKNTRLYFTSTNFRLDWLGREFKSNHFYFAPQSHKCYKELARRYIKPDTAIGKNIISIFTHEWQIYTNGKMRRRKKWMEDVCKFANQYRIGYEYPINVISNDLVYVINSGEFD